MRGEGLADADGWVVAWGLAVDGGPVHVIGVDGRLRMTLASPERAIRYFGRQPGVTARLVWLGRPDGAVLERVEAA